MAKILALILAVGGLGAGVGAGLMLRPEPEPPAKAEEVACDSADKPDAAEKGARQEEVPEGEAGFEYVKLNNQFVVPVVDEEKVKALVVLSLSLEVVAGARETIYQREPKLRDVFLQVLFDHANAGGFDGAFTNGRNMTLLRDALREVARKTLGATVRDVLIVDVVRQDA
jgi:hypothetical protein